MRIFLVAALSVCAWAQTGLERPPLGTMLDSNGAARPVYGVVGSVTLGGTTATGVLSIACSRQLCLMKTDSAIQSSAGAISAPPGPAVFGLDQAAAYVYFPESRQLARWHDTQLDWIPWDLPGEVLSLQAVSGSVHAAVRLNRQVSIVHLALDDGSLAVLDGLPDTASAVMLLGSGVLYADPDKVVLRRPDGTEQLFEVKAANAFFALGDGYVEIRAGPSTFALRIDPGRERLFLLPEPVPETRQ